MKYEQFSKRYDYIKEFHLEGLEEHKDQDKDGSILFKDYLTDDIEVCYWSSKDYEIEEIVLMIWKDGNCDYTKTLTKEESFKLRGKDLLREYNKDSKRD